MTTEMPLTILSAGKTLAVEFKGEEKASLNDRDLVETMVRLAKRNGCERLFDYRARCKFHR